MSRVNFNPFALAKPALNSWRILQLPWQMAARAIPTLLCSFINPVELIQYLVHIVNLAAARSVLYFYLSQY